MLDHNYPWLRLAVALLLSTIGGVGMWSVVVALPAVQAEFGVARGAASLPYTITMIGFGIASIFMGRLADRVGISSRLSSARCDDNAIHANARIADRVCRFYLQSRTEVAVQNGRNVE